LNTVRVALTYRNLIGTVQREDELSQKIDEWIKHEEAVEEVAAQASRTPTAEEKEKEEAVIQRRFMLARLGQKRSNQDSEGEQSEGEGGAVVLDENACNEEVARASAQERKKRKRGGAQAVAGPSADASGLAQVSAAMNSVGDKLSDGMLTAVSALVAARSAAPQNQERQQEGIEEKFKELRGEIGQDREAAERHRELMETQRAEDLARMERQRTEDEARMERQRTEDEARMEKQRAEDKAVNDARNDDLLARLFGKLEELKKN
jgi:hypothetical protein